MAIELSRQPRRTKGFHAALCTLISGVLAIPAEGAVAPAGRGYGDRPATLAAAHACGPLLPARMRMNIGVAEGPWALVAGGLLLDRRRLGRDAKAYRGLERKQREAA